MIFESEIIFENRDVVSSVVRPVGDPDSDNDGGDFARIMRESYRKFGILPVQTHSLNVGVIERGSRIDEFPDTDALVSFDPEIAVGVMTADCVPIVIYAPDVEAIAAIHAGWKGTLGGIVDNTVAKLLEAGAGPENMQVAFGPSISAEVYEVDFNLAKRFIDAGFGECVIMPAEDERKPHIDLQGVNVGRLERLGIPPGNIRKSDRCTFMSKDAGGQPLYPSYRREKTPLRLLTLISRRHLQ